MDSITFAELSYNYIDFVVVQFEGSPEALANSGGALIDLFSDLVFHTPVSLAMKILGKWMVAGDENIVAMTNQFDLDIVAWKAYMIQRNDSVDEVVREDYR